MPESIVAGLLGGALEPAQVLAWLRSDATEDAAAHSALQSCTRNEFALYFLSYLRSHTDSILQSGTGALSVAPGTPERGGPGGPHRRSISDPTHREDPRAPSPARDKKRKKVKTKLFPEERSRDSVSSDESRLSAGLDRLLVTSTPVRDTAVTPAVSPAVPVTPRCDTPRGSRHARAHDKTLADYIATAGSGSSAHKARKKRGTRLASDDSEPKPELDLSPDVFPEIGRKSSSLRSDKRRIKPTNIDLTKKSLSLNSFSPDAFPLASPLSLEENAAFRSPAVAPRAPNYEAERSLLRQERLRLVDKFSSMSAVTSPKCSTPLIKISHDSFDQTRYVTADVTRVTHKDKIDTLVEVYDALLSHNWILTYNAELYFLVSILLAKQSEDECREVESKLSEQEVTDYLLRSIHNSSYFAVRALWSQRGTLEVLLDKQSLKLLGELKSVRSLGPELAKCVLNAYGVRCEADAEGGSGGAAGGSGGGAGGVVMFHAETDNADNFPSATSFQSFKKQRDMFYEIVRWYWESGSSECSVGGAGGPGVVPTGSGGGLRSRVRALLAAGGGPCNRGHLARLLVRHLLASGGPGGAGDASRLSKLQRRLTRPPAQHTDSVFTADDQFYKELLTSSESASFRAHVGDALASELVALHHAYCAQELPGGELAAALTSCVRLARFLALLHAAPYSERAGGPPGPPPSETLLRNALALRTYYQPPLDIHSLLTSSPPPAVVLTTSWVCHYCAVLDPVSLRLPYFATLLRTLRALYRGVPGGSGGADVTLLRVTLAWLFAMPHVPQEVVYEEASEQCAAPAVGRCAGAGALLGGAAARRELGALLAGAVAAGGGGARHVTPLRVGAASQQRPGARTQARLEAAALRWQSAGSRRVLELAADRLASRAQRALLRALQPHTARSCASCEAADIRAVWEDTRAALQAAIPALLGGPVGSGGLSGPPGGPARALCAIAARMTRARLQRALRDYTLPGALCSTAAAELQALLQGSCSPPADPPPPEEPAPPPPQHSIAEAIIDLKEQVSLVLEGSPAPHIQETLLACAASAGGAGGGPWGGARGAAARRALLQLSADLCIALACRRPSELTEELLTLVDGVWSACCTRPARPPVASPEAPDPPRSPPESPRAPSPDSEGEAGTALPSNVVIAHTPPVATAPVTSVAEKGPSSEDEELLSILERLVCPRNVALLTRLGAGGPEGPSWAAYGALLVRALRTGWLTELALTARCVQLYRHDWDAATVSSVSSCLRRVSLAAGDAGRLQQFLSFLADYCADLAQ